MVTCDMTLSDGGGFPMWSEPKPRDDFPALRRFWIISSIPANAPQNIHRKCSVLIVGSSVFSPPKTVPSISFNRSGRIELAAYSVIPASALSNSSITITEKSAEKSVQLSQMMSRLSSPYIVSERFFPFQPDAVCSGELTTIQGILS